MSRNSTKKRMSLIKLTDEQMKEIGFNPLRQDDGANTKNAPSSSSRPKLEMIRIDPEMFKNLEDYTGSARSKKKIQTTAPSERVYQMKRTTMNKRISSITKKNITSNTKKKFADSTSKIKNVLLKSSPVIESCKSNARKQLFKVPVSKTRMSTLSTLKPNRGKFFEGPGWNVEKCIDQSPLIDLEKAKLLSQKSLFQANIPFKSENIQENTREALDEGQKMLPLTDITGCVNNITAASRTFDSKNPKISLDTEFEELERICEDRSPLNMEREIMRIHQIIQEVDIDFNKFKKKYDESTLKIKAILNEISRSSLKEKSLDKENKSPALSKSKYSPSRSLRSSNRTNDLRINLLKSNVKKSEKNTPTREKAINMYNDLRNAFSVLETPIKNCDDISVGSSKKNLSMKLQEQCMMLVQTPARK